MYLLQASSSRAPGCCGPLEARAHGGCLHRSPPCPSSPVAVSSWGDSQRVWGLGVRVAARCGICPQGWVRLSALRGSPSHPPLGNSRQKTKLPASQGVSRGCGRKTAWPKVGGEEEGLWDPPGASPHPTLGCVLPDTFAASPGPRKWSCMLLKGQPLFQGAWGWGGVGIGRKRSAVSQ